jgi:adenosylmethionine-8-amino-7-oxononanoate aminotransferase
MSDTEIDPESPVTALRSGADLRAADRRVLWHPFTQMQGWMDEDFPVIREAHGCTLVDADGKSYLDGVSSLWCALHGHRVPEIDAAVREQLDKVAHSTLLGLGGEPSIELAEGLVEIAPGELSRVFFSDSGSTAVEVALKMAFQFWRQTEGEDTRRTRFLCLQDGYHGDTLGSVSVGGIDLFHSIFQPLLFHTEQLPVPRGVSAAQREADVARCLEQLDKILAAEGDSFAALIMEPGVQGAAGIRVYPEGFTRAVADRARAAGLLVVMDEVATGFGRSGELFACQREGVLPDLLCLAKGLSGGYLPLAATLSSEHIFEGFFGRYEDFRSFFHGHTFTGNALACAAGKASLELCREPGFLDRAQALGDGLARALEPLNSLPQVLEIRRYGSMFGIELVQDRAGPQAYPLDRRTGHAVSVAARRRGAILRPLGDTVVLMPPLSMTEREAAELASITRASVEEVTAP